MDYSIIRDLLEERNMSFKELSDALGVDRNNLYNSLTKGNPTLQRLEAIAGVLDVPVWRLFTNEIKPELYGVIMCDNNVYIVRNHYELKKLANEL